MANGRQRLLGAPTAYDWVRDGTQQDLCKANRSQRSLVKTTSRSEKIFSCHVIIEFAHVYIESLKPAVESPEPSPDVYVAASFEEALTAKQQNLLAQARDELKCIESIANHITGGASDQVIVSIDIEMHIKTGNMLEVGLAWAWADSPKVTAHHLIVEENKDLTNDGEFDQRDNFLYGSSETVPLACVKQRLSSLLLPLATPSTRVVFAGHSVKHDIEWLKSVRFDIHDCFPQAVTCDIGRAFQGLRGDLQLTSLKKMKQELGLVSPVECMHNAGNDAYDSVAVLQAMVIGVRMSSASH